MAPKNSVIHIFPLTVITLKLGAELKMDSSPWGGALDGVNVLFMQF